MKNYYIYHIYEYLFIFLLSIYIVSNLVKILFTMQALIYNSCKYEIQMHAYIYI